MNYQGQSIINNLLENSINDKKSYLSSNSYRTCMSLIEHLQKITVAIYMVSDCVEDGEPLRNEIRTAVLSSMRLLTKMLGNVELSTGSIKQVHAEIKLAREHMLLLEIMGYVTKMNSTILLAEIDRFLKNLDAAVLDMDSPYHARAPMRSDMNLGLDLGELFYKRDTNTVAEENHDQSAIKSEFPIATNDAQLPIKEKPLRSEMTRLDIKTGKMKRRNLLLKILRDTPYTEDGHKELSLNDLVFKYARYSGEESVGTKTIQRELVDLVEENLIEKSGTKRWVTYKLKSLV